MTAFYFIAFLLACVGIYHIIEEVLWQIHVALNPEEAEAMMDFLESRKNNK